MNDFDPSLDEIVSAYVDGAATPDERARVESDPALVERAATFRSIHDALAVPAVPADDDRRHALIARALADTTTSGATVHTLRSRRSTTLGPIVAAAAVIAMFFGLGTWLVASQDNDDTSDTATVAAEADSFDSQGLRAPATTTGTAGGESVAPQSAPAGDSAKLVTNYLGAFADETALRDALLGARDGTVTSAATTLSGRAAAVGDVPTCGRSDPADAEVYAADLRGRPVTVVVSGTRADMYDDVTCQQTTIELPSS
ncbi:MAG TPA: hypothetical protein VM282_18390 [Acidimicrobiales bacterium]|nr:hypothetical protein [Acidimicrobiales bacterium]